MASPHTIERHRGRQEAAQQLAVLREKWPLAFPLQNARPLALGAVGQIAEAMGWSLPYTRGVLDYWKRATFYCQAVLAHDQRITLDGAPAEPVDAEAKEVAAKQLARFAVHTAAKKKAEAPTKAKPKSAPEPAPLRDQVRAGRTHARSGALPGRESGGVEIDLRALPRSLYRKATSLLP